MKKRFSFIALIALAALALCPCQIFAASSGGFFDGIADKIPDAESESISEEYTDSEKISEESDVIELMINSSQDVESAYQNYADKFNGAAVKLSVNGNGYYYFDLLSMFNFKSLDLTVSDSGNDDVYMHLMEHISQFQTLRVSQPLHVEEIQNGPMMPTLIIPVTYSLLKN